MKKTVLVILISSILLLLAVVIFLGFYQTTETFESPIYAEISSGDSSETIACWRNEKGEYYLFLPSYVNLSQVSLRKETSVDFFLDGEPFVNGMSGEDLQLDHSYALTYTIYGDEKCESLTVTRSGGVPTMYIDTLSGSMEYIHKDKNHKESAAMRLYDEGGKLCNAADIEAINGRGNSTWRMSDKKPYSLHFALDIDLLEMGAAKEWILIANAADESNIRNKLVYDFASEFGLSYSPDSKWVDLYLNGNYAGLYLLCERNEVYENRVNISGDNVSLVSMELQSRLEERDMMYIRTEADQVLRVHYPLNVNASTLAAVSNSWQSIENAILSKDGIDSITGKSWQELIDLESWAKKYLIEEIFGNVDGGYISQYFYIDGSGKAFAGPVWDYDYAIGNEVLWQLTSSNIQLVNKQKVNTGLYRAWFYALCQKEEFLDAVLSIYQSEFVPLMEDALSKNVDEYAESFSDAATMNSIRWSATQHWSEAVDDVVSYMNERIDFFDRLWFTSTEFYTVSLHNSDSENNAYQMIARGETVLNLPTPTGGTNEKFLGWYYVGTDERFDAATPIYEDTDLYAKWEMISSQRMATIVKIMPIGIIAIIFVLLLCVDIKRNMRKRRD